MPRLKSSDDYEARYDFDTLRRAEEIKANRPRHTKAIAHGKKEAAAVTKVISGAAKKR